MSRYKHLSDLCRFSGVTSLGWRTLPHGLYVFNYHRVGDPEATRFDPNTFSTTTAAFAEQVRLIRTRFEVINLARLLGLIEDGGRIDRALAMITFDDAYRDNYTNALPVLRELGVPAVFFAPTDFIGGKLISWWDEIAWMVKQAAPGGFRGVPWLDETTLAPEIDRRIQQTLSAFKRSNLPIEVKLQQLRDAAGCVLGEKDVEDLFMSWDDLRSLRKMGMDVGSHTQSHRILSHLDASEQRVELEMSKRVLESQLGEPIHTVAYPVGGASAFTAETQKIAKECGYQAAFSFIPGVNVQPSAHRFELRRIGVDRTAGCTDLRLDTVRATRNLKALRGSLSRNRVGARGGRSPAQEDGGTTAGLQGARCLVLGANTTALAVVRTLHRLGGRCSVVDDTVGSALDSKFCQDAFIGSQPDVLDHICAKFPPADSGQGGFLIATSDHWLRFAMRHREALASRFTFLHADNRVLELCLDKKRFYRWCSENSVSIPKTADGPVADWEKQVPLPLLVRVVNRRPGSLNFPKALEIRTREQLDELRTSALRGGYENDLLVTESLLSRRLIQYSVPFCRDGERTLAYVAEKRRPLPQACTVGTYVTTSENPTVANLAILIAERLGYYGIGELEVLHDQDTKENFIIELNARPWGQFSQQFAAGFDFLAFLLHGPQPTSRRGKKSGSAWLDLYNDCYCFKKDLEQDPGPRLGRTVGFLTSLLRARTYCYFSASDPKPFAVHAREVLRRVMNRPA